MNREIKFRAWDTRNKQMCYSVQPTHGNNILGSLSILEMPVANTTIHSDLILMQFTGLRDKNGKEIYEGDILKPVPLSSWKNGTCKIEYHGFAFMLVWDSGGLDTITNKNIKQLIEMKIIGNIYENPELLTKRI